MLSKVNLSDVNFLNIGNTVQLGGAIYVGDGKVYLVPLPDEDVDEMGRNFDVGRVEMLVMSDAEMARFLNQTDVLNVRSTASKAILRKSQRQIDQIISWRVFKRDAYVCRYCGRGDVPLTVDHIDLWEDGGATIEANLVTACRRCNKSRGNMEYEEWLASREYAGSCANLTDEQIQLNAVLIGKLPELRGMRMKRRSR